MSRFKSILEEVGKKHDWPPLNGSDAASQGFETHKDLTNYDRDVKLCYEAIYKKAELKMKKKLSKQGEEATKKKNFLYFEDAMDLTGACGSTSSSGGGGEDDEVEQLPSSSTKRTKREDGAFDVVDIKDEEGNPSKIVPPGKGKIKQPRIMSKRSQRRLML